MIQDATPGELLPDPTFLPPAEEWKAVPAEQLLDADESTKRLLNNGILSPGISTYRERKKELEIPNADAFRTIRRIPAPTGESAARLGNAYEFFKNLEYFSAFWPDTSLPEPAPSEDLRTTSEVSLSFSDQYRLFYTVSATKCLIALETPS